MSEKEQTFLMKGKTSIKELTAAEVDCVLGSGGKQPGDPRDNCPAGSMPFTQVTYGPAPNYTMDTRVICISLP